jgi:hypothetical protein
MTTEIHLTATVGEDRRLDLQLPEDAPIGPVELTIRAAGATGPGTSEAGVTARAAARAKMLAAGFLTTAYGAPLGARALSIEERIRAGTLPPGSRPSEELIDEERGAY